MASMGICLEPNVVPTFNARSIASLSQAHSDLQKVMHAAIEDIDFQVICATRSKEDQEAAFKAGHSKAHFGQSAHNFSPSRAVDCVPTPLDWSDIKSFETMAEAILGHAQLLYVPITWGGSWKMKDYPHFELTNWRTLT